MIEPIKYDSSFQKGSYAKTAQFDCGDNDINKLFYRK